MNQKLLVAITTTLLVGVSHAQYIHQSIVTLDSHIDIPITLGEGEADPGLNGSMQVDLPKMREGGLDIGCFIVYVGQGTLDATGYQDAYGKAQDKFAAIDRMLELYPDEIGLAGNVAQARELLDQGKLVAAIGVENAYPLGPELEFLQEFIDRDVAYVSLSHIGHNDFADSSMLGFQQGALPVSYHHGVSPMGEELIKRMNAAGVTVDVSHASKESVLDAAALPQAPLIASHSGVHALFAHPRNLTDEEIMAIAATGGVIQLVAFDGYMRLVGEEETFQASVIRQQMGLQGPEWFVSASLKEKADYRRNLELLDQQWPRANVAMLADHIDYVVNLVGIDHAGVASDFGGGGGILGWNDASESAALTQELQSRGYSREQIEKIWSGNLLRVWRQVKSLANNGGQQ